MIGGASAEVGKLVGIGIDVVEIDDFERISFDSNPAFYRRCFSRREIAYCRSKSSPARHFAARFAAKEAAVKAASAVVTLLPWDFEVERQSSGRPSLRLRRNIGAAPAALLAGHRIHVSLSHGETLATAVVALCRVRDQA
jgi:holo-[acyl-carrier protein] synthase